MKKIILLWAMLASTLSLAAQPVSEIDLLVGQTFSYCAAGTHLVGFSVEDGQEFVQASQDGLKLTIKGLKSGDATIRLSLRGGQSSKLLVHVLLGSPARRPGKTEKPEDTPEWTGRYELRLPQTNYSIIYHTFREDWRWDSMETYSCIGDMFVQSECIESEDGYNGMEDLISMFDFQTKLGYSGGLHPDGYYVMYYGDGNEIVPENRHDGISHFESYAPRSLAMALYGIEPAGFGRDPGGDDTLQSGTIMQRIRMTGGNQNHLKRYYRGDETVCGRTCWVFDFRGTNLFGYGGYVVWVDQETGLVLRQDAEEGGGFIVTRFDLDYHDWDIQIRPDLFK